MAIPVGSSKQWRAPERKARRSSSHSAPSFGTPAAVAGGGRQTTQEAPLEGGGKGTSLPTLDRTMPPPGSAAAVADAKERAT